MPLDVVEGLLGDPQEHQLRVGLQRSRLPTAREPHGDIGAPCERRRLRLQGGREPEVIKDRRTQGAADPAKLAGRHLGECAGLRDGTGRPGRADGIAEEVKLAIKENERLQGNDQFLAGYGAAQAIPGPLFAFAAYLGAAASGPSGGPLGATIAIVGIFLPSFLLVFGVLPFWDALRGSAGFRRALAGTNAAVVGILAAALCTPIATSAIRGPIDVLVAAAALGLLVVGKVPPILVVGLAAIAGVLIG